MKAAFLDRDGVINVDSGYVYRWEDFAFLPGAVGAMRRLAAAGYALVVVTNQSGIARGMYTEPQYQALTAQLRQALAAEGVALAAVYHCPHLPGGSVAAYARDCDCRKPAPGMLLRAQQELGIDMAASLMVGDKPSDIEAARAAGVGRAYLVGRAQTPADGHFADLAACVDALVPT
ncbi:D-glycero-beta-D-manno-heptose 1,7-bisphosphate 7-phosphatase [Solimonas sp. SE-A11]|uniref:D-glycero-beta-D-manno-heptose 1,7-bisphosphate 7-phosphatase n=1 Tax=Solimonas sp. SE-A11 TaxID=3054954 RepID=UPI00259C82CF|nr:D-glycero-beta-D-manno-heptose 1,7-bisphosphate 7-phosphatase [Solimonas sp. SE-A11]MDM4772072.1 D-glycero-beta-D-manno-heptose 1,7-bisphosphate 7-phosphatase [Solimonas sp. SE-A11]